MKTVIFGSFDLINMEHIDFIEQAKRIAGNSELIVIVKNNMSVFRDKGYWVMDEDERLKVVWGLDGVDRVVTSVNIAGGSEIDNIVETIKILQDMFQRDYFEFVFKVDDEEHNEIAKIVTEDLNVESIPVKIKYPRSSEEIIDRVVDVRGGKRIDIN